VIIPLLLFTTQQLNTASVSGELAFQTPDFDASFTCPYQFILYVTGVETNWVVMASRKGDRSR
jgi:hypothetical protein